MSVICFLGSGAKKGRDSRYSLTPFNLAGKRMLTLPKRLLHQRQKGLSSLSWQEFRSVSVHTWFRTGLKAHCSLLVTQRKNLASLVKVCPGDKLS